MTTYTNAEVDAVALAIFNAATEFTSSSRVKQIEHIVAIGNPTKWRAMARAALAARDALFELVHEKWELRDKGGVYDREFGDSITALLFRDHHNRRGNECSVVHVTTKRRKR